MSGELTKVKKGRSRRDVTQQLNALPEPRHTIGNEVEDEIAIARRNLAKLEKEAEEKKRAKQSERQTLEDSVTALRNAFPTKDKSQLFPLSSSSSSRNSPEESIWTIDGAPKRTKLMDFDSDFGTESLVSHATEQKTRSKERNARVREQVNELEPYIEAHDRDEESNKVRDLELQVKAQQGSKMKRRDLDEQIKAQRRKIKSMKKVPEVELKKLEYLVGISNGTHTLRKCHENPGFSVILDQNEDSTDARMCNTPKCFTILTGHGGHIGRHLEKCEGGVKISPLVQPIPADESLTKEEKDKLSCSVSDYILRSGKPFATVETTAFKNMIAEAVCLRGNVNKEEVIDALPSRKTVARLTMKQADEIIAKGMEKMLKAAEAGEVALIADHGKSLLTDYMALHGSYIDDHKGKFHLETAPIACSEVKKSKTAPETFEQIVEECEKVGMSEELVKNCFITTDGGLQAVGKHYMKGGIVCINHSINLMSQRAFDPYVDTKSEFSEEDLQRLGEFRELLTRCATLASAVRNNKKLRKLVHHLPKQPAPTRWLSNHALLVDMTNFVLPVLATQTQNPEISQEIRQEIYDLNRDLLVLQQMASVLGLFVEANNGFQTSSRITAHLVLRFLTYLKTKLLNVSKGTENLNVPHDENLELMALGAYTATLYQFQKNIGDIHYVADYLNPFGMFDELAAEKGARKRNKQTMEFLLTEIAGQFGSIPVRAKPVPEKKKKRRSFYEKYAKGGMLSDIDEEEEENDIHAEVRRYEKLRNEHRLSVEVFWPLFRKQLPILYKCAKVVLACVPSEAVCERTFSVVKNIVTSKRSRLDPFKVEKQTLAYMYTTDKDEEDDDYY